MNRLEELKNRSFTPASPTLIADVAAKLAAVSTSKALIRKYLGMDGAISIPKPHIVALRGLLDCSLLRSHGPEYDALTVEEFAEGAGLLYKLAANGKVYTEHIVDILEVSYTHTYSL